MFVCCCFFKYIVSKFLGKKYTDKALRFQIHIRIMTHYCHGENLFFSYCLCSFRFTGLLLFLLTLGSEYFVIYFSHFFVHYSFIRDMILSSYFIKRFKNIRMKKRETNYFFVTNMYGMISDRALKRSLNSFFALK